MITELVRWPVTLSATNFTVKFVDCGVTPHSRVVTDPVYMSRKIRKFRTDKFDTWNKRNFWLMQLMQTAGSQRLVPSRLHDLHESKFPFVSRIELIRSKLSNFSAHVYGVTVDSNVHTNTHEHTRVSPGPPVVAAITSSPSGAVQHCSSSPMLLSGRRFTRFPHSTVLGHLIREYLGQFHLQISLKPFVRVDFALDFLVLGESLLHTVFGVELRVSALVDVAEKRTWGSECWVVNMTEIWNGVISQQHMAKNTVSNFTMSPALRQDWHNLVTTFCVDTEGH